MEPKLTSAMIRGQQLSRKERFKAIDLARQGSRFDKCPVLTEFGIRIEPNPIVIDNASVIAPPVVRTLDSKGAQINAKVSQFEGKWNFKDNNEVSKKFLQAATLPKWMIFDCDGILKDEEIADNFIAKLGELGESLGMKRIKMPPKIRPAIKFVTDEHFHP
ncbi:uncharacterized protein LOC110862961 [Folsomia candida]|uniref:uncharacterized protein LOC110862961 n=1 Tax=Folsomia candida TaxID=158441 RepID=UPI000B8F7973|nr:uncharacterized protein LOC110862961 [Folsomia candida]